MVKVIVGLQLGNEGKDRIIQREARRAKAIVKCTGGENDENVVCYNNKQYVTHLLPSSVFQKGVISILGKDVVLNLQVLLDEITMLQDNGVTITDQNLKINPRAKVIMPWHIEMDKILESWYPKKCYVRGISSCYKEQGESILVIDLFDRKSLLGKISKALKLYRSILPEFVSHLDVEKICSDYWMWGQKIKPFIENSFELLMRMIQKDDSFIILEGASKEGFMCASASTNEICEGAEIAFSMIDEVLGVVKAYTVKSECGPFPTEISDENNKILQFEENKYQRGKTFSRCGWLDIVMIRHKIITNGVTHLAMNGMNAITKLKQVQVCTAYEYKHLITRKTFPPDLERCIPCYNGPIYPACSMSKCKRWEDIPMRAREYVRKVQSYIDIPIEYIGVGEDNIRIVRCPKEITVF